MKIFKRNGGEVNHLLAALVENGYYEDHRLQTDADYQPSWQQLLVSMRGAA